MSLEQPTKVYLAIPYTFNPNRSFEIANKVAADLMNKGYIVFSPVSHSHPVADHLLEELRIDHDFWMKQDLSLITDWADEVHVIVIGEDGHLLIENSRGVKEEIKTANEFRIPVKLYEYYA